MEVPMMGTQIELGNVKAFACVRCSSRKVKCDKLLPRCSKCERGNIHCEYKAPPPPRRRKRRGSDVDLQSKVLHYEKLLKKNGLPVERTSNKAYSPGSDHSNGTKNEVGFHENLNLLTGENAQSKDLHNPLWESIHEFQKSDDTSSQAEDEQDMAQFPPAQFEDAGTLLLSNWYGDIDLRKILPPADTCAHLWRIYQQNFNPLVKVIHVPTMSPIISQASEAPDNLSLREKTLVLAIFLAATITLENQDCLTLLGESQQKATDRLRHAAKQALVKSEFMSTSDDMIFQAYFIFIVASRAHYSAESLWSMNGVAMRIGLRLGFSTHDCGGKTPFQSEMRRRLWWQVCIFDGVMSEVAQQRGNIAVSLDNIAAPLNVNDVELHPAMRELPEDREGPTEMMLCRIRFEVGMLLRKSGYRTLFDNVGNHSSDLTIRQLIAEKDAQIEFLQCTFESKYLRYCDPLDSSQTLATVMARCVIAKLKLMAHHPKQYADNGASLSKSEKEMLFKLCSTILEYDSVVQNNPNLRGFKWHTSHALQWLALVYLLSELRTREPGPEVDKAWNEIEIIWRHHPELFEKRKRRPLFRAICSLAVAAWQSRETMYARKFGNSPPTPAFINIIRASRRSSKATPSSDQTSDTMITQPSQYGSYGGQSTRLPTGIDSAMAGSPFDQTLDFNIDPNADPSMLTPIDWNSWESLVKEFEWHETHSVLG